MAIDDDAQIDPATLMENVELINAIDAAISGLGPEKLKAPAAGNMEVLVTEAVEIATKGVAVAVAEREGKWPKEEDLRSGLASALRRTDAVVFTEARLRLDGWTANLGGFDVVAVGPDASIVVIETKWADGTLWQALWDVVKLASATTLNRVSAAYAVYSAPAGDWEKKLGRNLFGDSESQSAVTDYILTEDDGIWDRNLKGSTAYPAILPGAINIKPITRVTTTVLGRDFEVRAIRVAALPSKPLQLDRGRLAASAG